MSQILHENAKNDIYKNCKTGMTTKNADRAVYSSNELKQIFMSKKTVAALGSDYHLMIGMGISNQIGVVQNFILNADLVDAVTKDITAIVSNKQNHDAIGADAYERLADNACARLQELKEGQPSNSKQCKSINAAVAEITGNKFLNLNAAVIKVGTQQVYSA